MNINEARNHYYTHTGNLSTVNRQLAVAGIAIIWLFTTKTGSGYTLPGVLQLSLLFFVASLLFDLAQYAILSATWNWFFRKKEKEGVSETDDFRAPIWINRPGEVLFWLKAIFNAIAFLLLGWFMFVTIS